MRRADSGLVFKYGARPTPNPIYFDFKRVCEEQSTNFSVFDSSNKLSFEIFRLLFLPRSGGERSFACIAADRSGSVAWYYGKHSAPIAAVNSNGAALASVSVNVMGGQGTLPYSRQIIAATTSNVVYEGASIALQEHVKVLQLHYVGGMQSTGSTVQGCMSPCLPVLRLT